MSDGKAATLGMIGGGSMGGGCKFDVWTRLRTCVCVDTLGLLNRGFERRRKGRCCGCRKYD